MCGVDGCMNNGTCILPNTCLCTDGYEGLYCQTGEIVSYNQSYCLFLSWKIHFFYFKSRLDQFYLRACNHFVCVQISRKFIKCYKNHVLILVNMKVLPWQWCGLVFTVRNSLNVYKHLDILSLSPPSPFSREFTSTLRQVRYFLSDYKCACTGGEPI